MDITFSIHFAPLVPVLWLWAIGAAGIFLLILSLLKYKRGILWRALTFTVFILNLLNPALIEEEREPVTDIAAIVVDDSPSQGMGSRKERSEAALAHLQKQFEKEENIELRVIRTPSDPLASETQLFDALDRSLADIPQKRRAGTIIITDGQVHDVPQNEENFDRYGPVHTLLSGGKNEKDRQLVITQAPAYGIVGQDVTLKYKIQDTANIEAKSAIVTYQDSDGQPRRFTVPVGVEKKLQLPITHAGQNVFEIEVETVEDEITAVNNRTAILVNGVRDRLKVLLVSGQPHAGGRTWRDLLTSDPGVDLVHFTILREPNKLDNTPQDELALIAFPFRELFEIKLYDFDLIIFDRYRLNRILPHHYFENIAKYVEEGGALLQASGPSYATNNSVYNTPLMSILPDVPTEQLIKASYTPSITDTGRKHPVTQDLHWSGGDHWGPWLRQVVVEDVQGDTLMNGAGNHPLLILNRVSEGRIAHLTSDHIWLWSRGYEGGGPHAELLRRVVHWLMKEPELDEQALKISVQDNQITISTPEYKHESLDVQITKPNSAIEIITLEPENNLLQKTIAAETLGVYRFKTTGSDLPQNRVAVIGDLDAPELSGVITTPALLAPLMDASGGKMIWLSENPTPNIKLRSANNYIVTGSKNRPLLPPWLSVLFLLGLTAFTWWREGRST